LVLTDEERKANVNKNAKKHRSTEKWKATRKKYNLSEKGKAKEKKNRKSEKGKIAGKRYSQSEKARVQKKEYQQSEVGKAKTKAYKQTENWNETQKKYVQSEKGHQGRRLKVLQHYSKSLSNSDIPCCRCCGENFHIDFLALDHITGRKEMDSEPELKKLGYSSKIRAGTLTKWIIDNNYPDGFQILCNNCNQAKFQSKNNTCPHKRT